MKQLLFTLVLILPMVSFAQTNSGKTSTTQKATELPGLKVFGIGFETTRTKYEKELAKKGYTNPSKLTDVLGNYDQYTVEFAGYENCKFSIYYNVNTDSITQIRVDFPYTNYLDNHYANSSIIKQLNEKYGKSKEDRMNWGVRTEGQVSNDWTYNGIRISTVFLWNSESDKVGDNKFHLHYYTKAKSSKAIKPSDDL